MDVDKLSYNKEFADILWKLNSWPSLLYQDICASLTKSVCSLQFKPSSQKCLRTPEASQQTYYNCGYIFRIRLFALRLQLVMWVAFSQTNWTMSFWISLSSLVFSNLYPWHTDDHVYFLVNIVLLFHFIRFFFSFSSQLICSRKNKTQEVKQRIEEYLEGKLTLTHRWFNSEEIASWMI